MVGENVTEPEREVLGWKDRKTMSKITGWRGIVLCTVATGLASLIRAVAMPSLISIHINVRHSKH